MITILHTYLAIATFLADISMTSASRYGLPGNRGGAVASSELSYCSDGIATLHTVLTRQEYTTSMWRKLARDLLSFLWCCYQGLWCRWALQPDL